MARCLPQARGKAELFPGITSQFNSLTARTDQALDFASHIGRREPILSVHIALFDDATLVSLRWADVVCDNMRIKGLLMVWTMALHERSDNIPPF